MASVASAATTATTSIPSSISIPSWFLPYYTYLLNEYTTSPHHLFIEIALFIFVIYLFTSGSYDPKKGQKLSAREEDELIAEWTPTPLTPPLPTNIRPHQQHIVDSVTGTYVVVDGKKRLNWASQNFLGLAGRDDIKTASRETIDRYGVGSCGPRGFYGSFDKHLDMEAALAKFMGTKACVLYSDGIACVSSVIPAFSKRGDLIVCDSGCNFGIQQGVHLSRSNTLYFKHNDMSDLERTLAEVEEKERRKPPAKLYRKFIVVEGLYQYHGTIAPLRRLIELKHKYKYRIILDDSLAFGVLGETGRGSAEHAGVPVTEIDLLCATMDASLSTVGGFCAGTKQVVDHQRLAGAGYCFSAAAPPYASTAGLVALGLLDSDPSLCSTVRNKATRMRAKLADIPGVVIAGDDLSPVIPIRLSPASSTGSALDDRTLLDTVSARLWDSDIVVLVPDYIPADRSVPPPCLRLVVTAQHTDADIDRTAQAIKQAMADVLRRK